MVKNLTRIWFENVVNVKLNYRRTSHNFNEEFLMKVKLKWIKSNEINNKNNRKLLDVMLIW